MSQIEETTSKENTDTERIVATMFDILKTMKKVSLENIILNRISFAQTVENLFALSFLVKDGRVVITMDDKGYHFVCMSHFINFITNNLQICYILFCNLYFYMDAAPRNAPSASMIYCGKVAYSHFIFKFDFNDWKVVILMVAM